ncbi:MAG: hypothetical protein KC441_00390 [Anaerolineales bacterium]|nr:hypothetical protein [Anaerolineales bacterium]
MTQTAVPSPSATLPPTATPQPTLIPTPESPGWILQPTPTVFPITTPAASSDGYQLQDWDEAKAMEFIQLARSYAENVQPVIDTLANQNEVYADAQSIVKMAIYEALLRFPETVSREWLEWQLAYSQAIQGKPEATALVVGLLEAGFADGRYTLDNLNDSLKLHRFAIQTGDYKPYPLEATNLFGGGEINDLRLITTLRHPNLPHSDGALIAVSRENPPHITPITSNWSQGFGRFSQIWLRDLTNDTQPELLIDWDISSGGVPCHTLNILRWQGENFTYLDEESSLRGCHGSMEFVTSGESLTKIVTTELFPGDTITETFFWDGSRLTFAAGKSTLPSTPNPTANRYYGLFYDDETLIELKEKILESWSGEWSREFGASFPDVLRFQQAMLHLSLNEEEKASLILRNILESPANPQSPTFSTIAESFLNAYHSPEDSYQACIQALQTVDAVIEQHKVGGNIDFQALQNSASFNVYPDGLIFICSPLQSLERTLHAWNANGLFRDTSLPDFLSHNNIQPVYLIPVDLDGDGPEDWLASINMIVPGSTPTHHILAFLNSSEGVSLLSIPWSGDELSHLSIETIELPGYEFPVQVITSSDKPLIFAIENENDTPKLKTWFDNEGWYWLANYDFRQSQSGDSELVVSYEPRPYLDAYTEAIYGWNPDTQDFELLEKRADNSLGIPLDEAIAQAEALLLQEGKFEAAIPMLTAVLAELRAQNELTWAIPRPLYLLGLAYELSGDETNAVDAYWTLWQTFPESPYALLAQAKLELKP